MQLTTCQQRAAVTCGGRAQPTRPRQAVAAPFPAPSKALRTSGQCKAAAEEVQSVSSNGASNSSANPLDFEELTDIIRMVHDTDIVELELKSKKFSFALRKREAIEVPEPVYITAAAPAAAAPAAASAPAPLAAPAAAAPAAPAGPPPPAVVEGVEVLSPMSGTYYRSPAPGEPPFVREGDKVEKGQTICIVEAMKLMNTIEAEVSGTVAKLIVDNGSPVTPGQPLILIKP